LALKARGGDCFAKTCDLPRYLKTLLFLIHVTTTHVRKNAGSGAKSCLVEENLVANGLRSHVAREVAISGAKTDPGRYGFDLCEEDGHRLL
jgi:hypothetical protein